MERYKDYFNKRKSIKYFSIIGFITGIIVISFFVLEVNQKINMSETGIGKIIKAHADNSNIMDMAFPCGFTNPAFCDNFSEGPATGTDRGRGGDLNVNSWSFNRTDAGMTNGMNDLWSYYPTTAQHCKTPIYNILPDNDSFFCGLEVPEPEHWMEAFNDSGSFAYNDAMVRQPFDFTNRTGTIQYGVDAKNGGSHGWWTETWITDQPAPGPDSQHNNGPSDDQEAQPANGIGIAFDETCNSTIPPGDTGAPLTGPATIYIVRNHTIDAILGDTGNQLGLNNICVTAKPDSANLIQIKLSTTHLEVWMSDNGSNVMKQVWVSDINPPLPFSVGYVHFEHVQYNASKFNGLTSYQTYHWHDMGFDGPILPTPRGYEVPDSLTPASQPAQNGDGAGVNLGYMVDSMGKIYNGAQYIPNFTFNNVNVTNASRAMLNLNSDSTLAGTTFYFQFNNGPVRSYTVDQGVTGSRQTHSIPVPLTDLIPGTNTLIIKSNPNTAGPNMPQGTMSIANIDLEVVPNGSPIPAPYAGTIPCSLFTLMMSSMPSMQMITNPCNIIPIPVIDSTVPLNTYKSAITISGAKDASENSIMVNNSTSGLSYSDSTHWSVNESLNIGINNFSVNGMDSANNMSVPVIININRHEIGNIKGTGVVDLTDLSIFAKDWHRGVSYGTALYNPLSDLNGDGNVDLTDLSIFAKNWNK